MSATALRHHLADVGGGVRLHCLLGGDLSTAARDGRVAVLLHGWPETGRAWGKVAPLLVTQGYAVVAPDLRGLGGSSRTEGGYDKATVAADVRGLVRDALGVDGSIRLVGHDIGGMVAFAYARRWPGEVSHLALLDCLLPGHGLEAMFAASGPGRFAHMPLHMAPDGIAEALVAGREDVYLGWFFRNLVFNQGTFTSAEVDAYVREYRAPGALRAGFEHYRAFWRDAEDNRAAAAKGRLAMPVLAVTGKFSVGDALARSLQPLAERIRGVVHEACGHFIPAEQPERLAEELLAFFAER